MLIFLVGWIWFGPLRAWRSIDRVAFNPTAAREVLAQIQLDRPVVDSGSDLDGPPQPTDIEPRPPAVTPSAVEQTPSPSAPSTVPEQSPAPLEAQATGASTEALDVFLILGSDEKPDDPDIRADAILLLLVPHDRTSSMLVSIPRLLMVTSPCRGEPAPININLEGCGTVSGLDLMGVAVEDYTGLAIDHLVLFDFAGFQTIIDRIGGLEVCVEHPVKLRRDLPVFLEPGCSLLDGGQSLMWVRSRQTLESVNGEWQLMAGAGDAGRTKRQRNMVRQVIGKAHLFESPAALSGLVSELSESFALDAGFGLGEALDLAWELRSLGRKPAHDVSIATTGAVSPGGDLVLIPDEPFSVYLEPLGS